MKKLVIKDEKLMLDWDWTKNDEIGLNPTLLTCGSHKIAHWKGHTCGHEWQAIIKNRSNGEGCPICIGKKIMKGVNDFGTNYPNLLKDWDYNKNLTVSPFGIYRYSTKRVWWICHKCGYKWQAPVFERSRRGYGCPCCSRKVAVKGVNDFETMFPLLAKEWDYSKNTINPYEVTPGSNKKVWWICLNGHDSYCASIDSRKHGAGCPVCNTMFQTSFPEQAILFYVKKLFPDALNKYKGLFKTAMELDIYIPSINVAIEYDGAAWHKLSHSVHREKKKYNICREHKIFLYRVREESSSKDNADKVYSVPAFSFSKLILFNEVIENLLKDISNDSNIDVNIERDMFEILKYKIIKYEDSLAHQFPEVCKEWHPTLNKGLKPENVLPGTTFKVWWKCSKCGNEWQTSVNNRTKGHGCDICARVQRKIVQHETLINSRESLIGCECVLDWDYAKNKHDPDYYTKGSGVRVWWKCHNCAHEWRATICDRTRDYKNGCPACSNRILVKGKNDLQTTNSDLAKEWDYEKNQNLFPSDIAQWSHTKVWWKYSKCGYSYQATPSNRVFGKGCGCCAGRVVVTGINDLTTTRPDIAVDWHPTKNGDLKPTDVTKGRKNVIWWKCHVCGYEWQDSLNHRNSGRGCPNCNKKKKHEINIQ